MFPFKTLMENVNVFVFSGSEAHARMEQQKIAFLGLRSTTVSPSEAPKVTQQNQFGNAKSLLL